MSFIRTLEIRYEIEWFFYKNFDKSHLKFEKLKKLENSIDNPLIINETFSKAEIISGKLDFDHIMHFQLTKCLQ